MLNEEPDPRRNSAESRDDPAREAPMQVMMGHPGYISREDLV